MKKVIVFYLLLTASFNLLGMDTYDTVLNQLNNDITIQKSISINDLSPEICSAYLTFINSSQRRQQQYALLAVQLRQTLAPSSSAQEIITVKDLSMIAVTQGYGYKYANLTVLKNHLCKEINRLKRAYSFAVPEFAGIPSEKVQAFLKNYAHFNTELQWTAIIKKYFPNEQIRNKTIATKRYPEGFLQECENFETRIKGAFNAFIQNNNINTLNFDKIFDITGVSGLITAAQKAGEKLMTRSSGKEDTKELANAGGNESVSNVTPNVTETLKGTRDVVASYFGNKSLIQRLGAGDKSIFDFIPFTPVLIQRMIGEKNPITPPKCGVMFTEETEGGISQQEIRNDDGSIKTTGISIIQAAYGHNEGVVNSLIPVDTFYVDADKNIYPVIRPKTYRMAPAAERALKLEPNNDSLVHKPALNKVAIESLKAFATLLETEYQGPMDVEFVIDEQQKTIFIVQARPIVHNAKIQQPSYIIKPELIEDSRKITGSAIGVAGGALRTAINKNNIIIGDTIGKALTLYQSLEIDTSTIQCIIVGTMAPTTSHEATTFRSEGKPVIYTEQIDTITQWIENGSTLVVSPQQGLIINWQNPAEPVTQLIKNKIAANGWIEYPIPRFMSLNDAFKPAENLSIVTIQAFLPPNVNAEQLKHQLNKPWKESIHILKTGTPDQASLALVALLTQLHTSIHEKAKQITGDKDLLNKTMLLQRYAVYCARLIRNNLDLTQANPDYIKRLLPIRFFESILYQQPKPTEIVDGYSAATVIAKEMAVEQKITQELAAHNLPTDSLTVQLLKVKDFATVPELEQQWQNFITQLSLKGTAKIKDDFTQLMIDLGKLDLLPLWINSSFAQEVSKHIQSSALAQVLIDEYTSQNAFLTELFEKKAILDALNSNAFDDPKKFTTQWKNFDTLLSYFLNKKTFLKMFNSANNLGKLAALSIMTKLVDTFDLSIKAVTGSTNYTIETKLTNFRTMLVRYAELFKTWITLVPEGTIIYNKHSPLSAFISAIDSIINKQKISADDLKSTTDFNVSAFTIGSGVSLQGGYPPLQQPKSFEDIFTMVHQCLLTTINALNAQSGINKITLPQLQNAIADNIAQLQSKEGKASLISTQFLGNTITLLYNLPLRSHSVQITLSYKKNAPSALVTLQFFGANEVNRWNKIACLTKLVKTFTILDFDLDSALASKNSLILKLNITEQSNAPELYKFIENIAQYSYDRKPEFIKPYLDQLHAEGQTIINKKICPELIFLDMLAESEYSSIFPQALDAATKATKSADSTTHVQGLELLQTLVEQKYEIDTIVKIAKNDLLSDDPAIQERILYLLEGLAKEGVGQQEALQAINHCLSTTDPDVQEALLFVTAELITQNDTAISQALKLIDITLNSTIPGIQDALCYLMQKLIEKEPATVIPKAVIAINNTLQSTDKNVQAASMYLIRALLQHGEQTIIPTALEVVKNNLQSPDDDVQAASMHLIQALLQQGEKTIIPNAIKAIEKNLQSPDDDVQAASMYLIQALLQHGEQTIIPTGLEVVKNNLQSPDDDVQAASMHLIQALLQQGEQTIIPNAIKAIEKNLQSDDNLVQSALLRLTTELVRQKQLAVIPTALEAIEKHLQSDDNSVQCALLLLIEELVRQGEQKVIPNALVAVENNLQSDDNFVQATLLRLTTELVRQKQPTVIPTALKVITKNLQSDDTLVQSTLFSLIDELMREGQPNIIPTALEAIEKNLQSDDTFIQSALLRLTTELVRQKQLAVIPNALKAIEKNLQSDDTFVQSALLSLIEELVRQGEQKVIPNALVAVENNLQSTDAFVQAKLLYLTTELVHQKQPTVIPTALKVITKNLQSDDTFVQSTLFSLIDELMREGQPNIIPTALEAIEKNLQSDDTFIQSALLSLIEKLINQNEKKVIPNALKTIENHWKSTNPTIKSRLYDILNTWSYKIKVEINSKNWNIYGSGEQWLYPFLSILHTLIQINVSDPEQKNFLKQEIVHAIQYYPNQIQTQPNMQADFIRYINK